MPSGKPIVFVSYAHRDEPGQPRGGEDQWLSFVLEFLRPAEMAECFELWVDQLMIGGANWEAEIEAKLRTCDIFILLVSARSMASRYILRKELPIVRERDARGEAVHIYPVLLTPHTDRRARKNKRQEHTAAREKPLSEFSEKHRLREMAKIADEIASWRVKSSHPGTESRRRRHRGAGRLAKIDIGHLPETSYKTLVGRDDELARLDAAWADSEVNVLSLVAEGGAGKSALLNEWLTRLRRDNYRGAEVVLGWSFYSQGTHERATSAEPFLDWALQQLGATAKANSASAKGEAIAEAMMRRRVLLALDGVEPLQHGPTSSEPGKLKDQGLRALLRHFAAAAARRQPGLIVLTSRIEVADIAKWKKSSRRSSGIENLSDAAGAKFLPTTG